jgi:hypothetical protein
MVPCHIADQSPRHPHATVDGADLSLINRGAAVLWEGEGRYDRAWHNHLDLTIDKDSKVEMMPPMSFKGTPNRSPAASEEGTPATKDEL